MHEYDATLIRNHPLLAAQLELLENRRADVVDLLELGGEHDEVLLDAIANDIVGARLVIRAVLAEPTPYDLMGVAREVLEFREHEAHALLRIVFSALRL